MERLLRRIGRGPAVPESKRILELNPDHPAVAAVRLLFDKDSRDPRIEDYCRLLYDEAVIAEGSRVKDPAALARRINDLLARQGAG
jgi:molecular chaperone HtpG